MKRRSRDGHRIRAIRNELSVPALVSSFREIGSNGEAQRSGDSGPDNSTSLGPAQYKRIAQSENRTIAVWALHRAVVFRVSDGQRGIMGNQATDTGFARREFGQRH
jgi:hypothetical protein